MYRVDRRTFLVGSTLAAISAACGGGGGSDDDGDGAAGDDFATRSGRVEWLVPTFPDGAGGLASVIAAGSPQRLAFVVRDDLDILRDGAPEAIDISINFDGELLVEESLPARREGIITPYYAVELTPPEPGIYTATTPGAEPIDFAVEPPDQVLLVQVGDPMRPVATPTVDDALGVDPICTRAVPCPFHDESLDVALTSGRPTVLLVATPGFCQTDICGPVVDLLIDAVGDRDDLSVVHGEVYVDPAQFETGSVPATTPVVDEYSLTFEPQLVVADGNGTVVARLDSVWDRSELADAIGLVSAG